MILDELPPQARKVAELLLQGCDNPEIAKELGIAERTVKAHLNKTFLRFQIQGGVKRVKLATFLYRRMRCEEIETNSAPRKH